ncbi:MAG: phage/plasmid primase, P4 family, partial [Mycetocola sp.]
MANTQNEITKQVTTKYLAGLDLARIPTPASIEESLIAATNKEFTVENTGRTGTHRINLLKRLSFSQVAQILITLHRVVRIAPSGKNTDRDYDLLAIYVDSGEDEGIYATSEDQIRGIARLYNRELTINEAREVITVLREEAPRVSRCADRDLIAVNNGLFDYRTKTLQPFNPEHVFLSKARVDYVPTALSPGIQTPDGDTWEVESWMYTLSDDPELVELLWEILGAIVRPHVRWNKSAWFYSEVGNNGKGTLVEMARNLVGSASYASIPISDFGKDFLLEPLTRASAILVDENDVGTFIDKAANLKAIITNDVISINRKHKTPIAYQFWGFMIQCLNGFPKIKDKSESFYRRQLFVPFTKSFTGAE